MSDISTTKSDQKRRRSSLRTNKALAIRVAASEAQELFLLEGSPTLWPRGPPNQTPLHGNSVFPLCQLYPERRTGSTPSSIPSV